MTEPVDPLSAPIPDLPGSSKAAQIAALDKGMAYRVTLLLRPRTFDEMPLVQHWSALAPWPVVLLPLTSAQNEPDAFLAGLMQVMSNIPAAGVPDAGIPDAGVGAAGGTVQTLEDGITSLLNAATTAPGDFAWILKDYDLITATAIHRAVGWWIDYAPPQMHIYLTSDREPPLPNLPRLRVRRQLFVLRL